MEPFLLNPARMSFRIPGVLGGLLLPGYKGEGVCAGNGDCLLLDGVAGLMGIADGTERSPQASRRFLKGIANGMENKARNGDLLTLLIDTAEEVLESFQYEDRTTFICLMPAADGSVFYVNGGDSLLLQLNPHRSQVIFINHSNMGFSGRSRQIIDSGRLEAEPGDLLVLTTDGIWDLVDGDNRNEVVRSFLVGLKNDEVHCFPDRFVRSRHPSCLNREKQPCDDFSMLLVDPFRVNSFRSRVLLGGTGSEAESDYQRLLSQKVLPDRYLPLPDKGPSLWTFPDLFPF